MNHRKYEFLKSPLKFHVANKRLNFLRRAEYHLPSFLQLAQRKPPPQCCMHFPFHKAMIQF